jgi:hypothetical protein
MLEVYLLRRDRRVDYWPLESTTIAVYVSEFDPELGTRISVRGQARRQIATAGYVRDRHFERPARSRELAILQRTGKRPARPSLRLDQLERDRYIFYLE